MKLILLLSNPRSSLVGESQLRYCLTGKVLYMNEINKWIPFVPQFFFTFLKDDRKKISSKVNPN